MNPSGGFLIFLSERVTLWLARAGSIGLAIMMFLTLADVVGRIFDHPVAGTVELTELIMGMIIYLGVGFTTFNRSHIRVDILITMMSTRVQAVLDVVTHVIATVFIGFVSGGCFFRPHPGSRTMTRQLSGKFPSAGGLRDGAGQRVDAHLVGASSCDCGPGGGYRAGDGGWQSVLDGSRLGGKQWTPSP